MSSTVHIPLTQGRVAVVDQADAALLLTHKWHAIKARSTFYAARRDGSRTIYMHREILGLQDAGHHVHVDHDDGDGLNNTRRNIKACRPCDNSRKRKSKNGHAGMRGVYRHGRKFVARIGVAGQFLYLGCFGTREEASAAYANSAATHFGAFAPRAGV